MFFEEKNKQNAMKMISQKGKEPRKGHKNRPRVHKKGGRAKHKVNEDEREGLGWLTSTYS